MILHTYAYGYCIPSLQARFHTFPKIREDMNHGIRWYPMMSDSVGPRKNRYDQFYMACSNNARYLDRQGYAKCHRFVRDRVRCKHAFVSLVSHSDQRPVGIHLLTLIPTILEFVGELEGTYGYLNCSIYRMVECGWLGWRKRYCKPWVNIPPVGLGTLLIFTHLQHIDMGPYSRWVKESFKQTLLDNCDEYLDTTDRGTDKTRSKLITRVAQDIAAIALAKTEELPDDLEKVNNLTVISFEYID